MPVFSPRIGSASRRRTSVAAGPKMWGWRQSRSPQRAKRAERCSPECTQRSASASTRGPSFASTAGSRVSVAASTKATLSMIPSAIERKAGLGTSITAESEIKHGQAGEEDGLAGGVHRHGDRVARRRASEPKRAPRKRWTMKSA